MSTSELSLTYESGNEPDPNIYTEKTSDTPETYMDGYTDNENEDEQITTFRFDIFVEYTLYSQKIIDVFIHSRDINNTYNLLVIFPDSVRKLIFKYYFIRKKNEVERLLFVGHLIFPHDISMIDMKKIICDTFGDKVPRPSKLMRIRHICNVSRIDLHDELVEALEHKPVINEVYIDNINLGTNCNAIYNIEERLNKMQICCQQLDKYEIFTDEHVLLNCVRCYYKHVWKMEEFVEIVFLKNDNIRTAKQRICEEIAQDMEVENMKIQLLHYEDFDEDKLSRCVSKTSMNDTDLLTEYGNCDILLFLTCY